MIVSFISLRLLRPLTFGLLSLLCNFVDQALLSGPCSRIDGFAPSWLVLAHLPSLIGVACPSSCSTLWSQPWNLIGAASRSPANCMAAIRGGRSTKAGSGLCTLSASSSLCVCALVECYSRFGVFTVIWGICQPLRTLIGAMYYFFFFFNNINSLNPLLKPLVLGVYFLVYFTL